MSAQLIKMISKLCKSFYLQARFKTGTHFPKK